MIRPCLLIVAALGIGASLHATSLSCQLNGNPTACYQQSQIYFDQNVNWLTGLGEAYMAPVSGPWATSNQAINVTLTSLGQIQRADNTGFAWDGAEWTLPDLVPNGTGPNGNGIVTFAGHFAAPDLETLSAPYATPSVGLLGGQFGDDLVGVLGGGALSISFASPVTSAGFMISSRQLANFSATIQAYDTNNVFMGTYSILAGGLGGACAGLGNLNPDPQPCTDTNNPGFFAPAPFVAFQSSSQNIGRLVIQTNDNNGFFIDQMYLWDGVQQGTPEPSTIALTGSGFCALAWILRRRSRKQPNPLKQANPL